MDTNLAYVAGLIDGEGCIHLDVTKGRWYQPRVSVGMTEPALQLLTSLKDEWGGTLYRLRKPTQKWAGAWTWHLTGPVAAELLTAIRPFLRLKTAQADAALELNAIVQSLPKTASGQARWNPQAQAKCAKIREQMKAMNKKGPRATVTNAEAA